MTLKFVICTNSPFSIVENKHFSNLISYVSCDQAHLPTTKTLISDLENKYQKIKTLLIERINEAKYVCLTADGWANKSRSFLGITIHMFDNDLNKHSFLLAFRRMFGRHTHDALKEVMLLVIHEFDIKINKITHIITDGASNFKKAFKVYGGGTLFEPSNDDQNETNCYDEDGQCDVEDDVVDLEMFASDDDGIFMPPDTQIMAIELNGNCEDTSDDENEINDIDIRLPEQLICYSHSLNRTAYDFEKTLDEKTKDPLNAAFSKLKKFWNLNSRSSVAHEIIQRVCKRSFPYPNAIRWNSKFDSISLAERYKLEINDAIDEINREARKNASNGKKGKKLDKLSAREWSLLKDYSLCMCSLAMGLDILQGDKRACQGYILPVLYGIKAGLQENLDKNAYTSEFGRIFHDTLIECFDKRFGDKMKICEENKSLILAAAIHPSFKLSWVSVESE